MSFDQDILRGVLLAFLSVAAAQDIRYREVSNWISVPLFVLGGIALVVTANYFGMFLSLVILAGHFIPGGYGAVDAKIMIGLIGLWPQTVPLALLTAAGMDLVWRKRGLDGAPLIVALLVGAVLSGSVEFFWPSK